MEALMPDPNAIVGWVERLIPPVGEPKRDEARGRVVSFANGRSVAFDPADPKAEALARVIDSASRLKRPVYIEVDPRSGYVKRLLLPDLSQPGEVRARDGGLDVLLKESHAIRRLDRAHPDFADFEKLLRGRDWLIVTPDGGDIIDVRGFRPGPDGDLPPKLRKPPFFVEWWRWFWRWPIWPWRWWWIFGCVSKTYAQQVFDQMSATICAPLTAPAPCIPFNYPTDGCWARAHEMVRLMKAMGLKPKKVWIQGWPLNAATKNDPDCSVTWGWHVAPTLCVRQGNFRFLWGEQMVIDPSLFTTPVTKAQWKAVQNNPSATLTDTDGDYYWWTANIPDDPGYASTNYYLGVYRTALINQSIAHGAPPYAHCP
jgi:hypothetical protein